jgi:hypothetical protein
MAARSKADQRRIMGLGHAARSRAADERAEAYRAHIEWALRQPGICGKPISGWAAAAKLNQRNIEPPRGIRWWAETVLSMGRRLGIEHPSSSVITSTARAKVHAIWKQRPDLTAKQLVATGLAHPLSLTRAEMLLRECRRAAAMHSPVHRRAGWYLDCRTAARIRIGELWKRQPEITVRQVIARLGPHPFMKRHWVQRVLRECWLASAKHSPTELRYGRRIYHRAGWG